MTERPVVLVTAGSAGLGAAMARLFARNGYNVVINYHQNRARAEQLLGELAGENGGTDGPDGTDGPARHAVIQADLAERGDVERLAREAHAVHGRLDAVCSNGGWTAFRDTTRLGDNVVDADWDRAFAVNVKSHLWLLHATEAYLAAREGAFTTTASLAGVHGMGSSLAAQIHMVRGLASMVAPRVRVNSVSPSLLETEWAARFSPQQKADFRARTKLQRFVTVEDVADQVLALTRNRGITGVNVVLDAGMSI